MSMRSDAVAQLKSFLERVERLEEERKILGDDIRLVYAEAKAAGFVPKAIREMIKRRRKDPSELAEEDTVLETYMHAAGMKTENPLAAAISALATDAMGRDQVIDAFKRLVPMHGEIIAKVGGGAMRIWRGEDGIAHAEEYAEPAPAPEKTGRSLKTSATVLTMVPKPPAPADAEQEPEPV